MADKTVNDLITGVAREESGAAKTIDTAVKKGSSIRKSLGVGGAPAGDMEEKGIRIKGRLVADREFQEAMRVQKRAVDKLAKEFDFKTAEEMDAWKRDLNTRLNKTRRAFMERALQMQFDKKWEAVEAAKKRSFWSSLGGVLTGGISAVIGGIGGGGDPTGTTGGAAGKAMGGKI